MYHDNYDDFKKPMLTMGAMGVEKFKSCPNECRVNLAGAALNENLTHWLWTAPSLHYSAPHLGKSGFEAWALGTSSLSVLNSSSHRC